MSRSFQITCVNGRRCWVRPFMSWRFGEDGRVISPISLSDLISIRGSKMHFEALNWHRMSHDVIMQDSSRSEEQGQLNLGALAWQVKLTLRANYKIIGRALQNRANEKMQSGTLNDSSRTFHEDLISLDIYGLNY